MKIIILALLFSHLSFSAIHSGIEFPDSIKVKKQNLILNGAGLRLATFFNVKVYIGALYLNKKLKDSDLIFKNQGSKKVIMHFLRDVDRDDVISGFKKSLNANNLAFKNYESLFQNIKNIKEGEKISITIFANSIELEYKDSISRLNTIKDTSAFLSLWIAKAPNEELKNGMLGL